jgi:hypothetical protein
LTPFQGYRIGILLILSILLQPKPKHSFCPEYQLPNTQGFPDQHRVVSFHPDQLLTSYQKFHQLNQGLATGLNQYDAVLLIAIVGHLHQCTELNLAMRLACLAFQLKQRPRESAVCSGLLLNQIKIAA